MLKRGRAERFVDLFAGIEVCELSRNPAITPPDPASMFKVRNAYDALHDAAHWPAIWSHFGPQIPAILCKETQTDPKIRLDFNILIDVHLKRNGASDAPDSNSLMRILSTY